MAVSQWKQAWLTPNLEILWISVSSFWLCGSIVANRIIYRLVPRPSRFETRQYGLLCAWTKSVVCGILMDVTVLLTGDLWFMVLLMVFLGVLYFSSVLPTARATLRQLFLSATNNFGWPSRWELIVEDRMLGCGSWWRGIEVQTREVIWQDHQYTISA